MLLWQDIKPIGFIAIVDTKINTTPAHLFEKDHVFLLLLPDKKTDIYLAANSQLEKDRWSSAFIRLQVWDV